MSTLEAFLEHLERRLNIHVVQQILRESKLLSARSWSELTLIVKSATQKDPSIIAKLEKALVMQQLCDLKAVAFYEVDSNTSKILQSSFKSVPPVPGALTSSFPLDADSADLEKDDGKLKVVATFEDDYGAGVVLSRRRTFTVNNEIYADNFTPELKQQFPNADKIIEVKNYNRQTYDVIYVNAQEGMLEIRADMTRENGLPQTSGQLRKSIDDLRTFVDRYVSTVVKGYNLNAPLNLLPLAKKVYEDKSGLIKKIGFATEEDSVKRETMKAGVDLRTELFHKTGAQAIDHKMAIFEVAIQWHGDEVLGGVSGSKPEIYIPGSFREYVKAGARTDYLFVKGVRTYADSNFVLKKLKSYK